MGQREIARDVIRPPPHLIRFIPRFEVRAFCGITLMMGTCPWDVREILVGILLIKRFYGYGSILAVEFGQAFDNLLQIDNTPL